jgi:DNA-directed RNA polymerase II subunit RPB2
MATSLSEHGVELLSRYFQENEFALTRHHIDSYEQCMLHEIPTIIHTANPIVFLKGELNKAEGIYAYRVELFIGGDVPTPAELGLQIQPPTVSLDGGHTVRRLLPNEARLRNLTYSAQILADILVRVTFTTETAPNVYSRKTEVAPLIKGFPLFKMPILLRSCLCPTGVQDPVRLEEMGECRNDYGGYFIICGAEKILITREEQAFNSLYVEQKLANDLNGEKAYASVVSLHPETKQTRRVAVTVIRDGSIRVGIPMIRGTVPLFVLFRAIGVESDEDIVRMIYPEPTEREGDLIPSIYDAYPILNRFLAIKYISSLTKGFTEAHVFDIVQNLMLPHVLDEPLARAQYLAEMVRATLEAAAGKREKTSRDDMRNKRFLTTGTLVRELFNGCFKDFRAAFTLTTDRTYRANSDMYTGSRIFDLFTGKILMTLFQPATLDTAILRGFRGKWGTNERNTKTGVMQPLARISYLDATSHMRRVVSDFPAGEKSTGPRKMHTSQVGYFCTSETPTGSHIGLTKNMSIMTQFSLSAATRPVYEWLKAKGGVIMVGDTTAPLRAKAATVQMNGGTVGFTLDPRGLVRTLRFLKWTACISVTASISFSTSDNMVRIYLDEGRPVRPLWHLNGEGAAFVDRLPVLMTLSWPTLVFGSFPATAEGAALRSVRFLDPLGERADATFADYEALLAPVAGFIEYCDPMEMNEAYVSWWGDSESLKPEHTHCEIHPSTLTGLLGSMIPFSNHNQAPRNQLSGSQSKQGIGTMVTNLGTRFDTYSHQLCYGEAPLCTTLFYDVIGRGEMPYGFNCIIAAASITGYNQDDGLIINSDSIERGMFKSLSFRSYDAVEEVDPISKVHSHIGNPDSVTSWSKTALRSGVDYTLLDERGIIREGAIINDTTVLVGRYKVVPGTNEIKDDSVMPKLYTQGRVDSVAVIHQDNGRLLVRVRIIEMRDPVLGDKFSSRHGQKGTIGALVRAIDMPRTAEGIVPDVIVNPGGLISRMTVAQLVEMVAGRAAAEVTLRMNATSFCNGGDIVKQVGDVLEGLGAERTGENIMYSGVTGEQIRTQIFMCPLYFMRLKHLTEDKVNSRGQGRKEILTHQPTGGRANEGGLRVGEMERDSLCAHGVSSFLQESMMKRGDAATFWICNGCGRMPIFNEPEQLFVCPTCDGPLNFTGLTPDTLTLQLPTKKSRASFSKIEMPYVMKLIDQEMTAMMNGGFRFLTSSTVTQLKDAGFEWNSLPVPPDVITLEERTEIKETILDAGGSSATASAVVSDAVKATRTGTAAKNAGIPRAALSAIAEGNSETTEIPVTAIIFNRKMKNEFIVFSNFAPIPFQISGAQVPAPDGSPYADLPTQAWPTVEHYYQAMKFPQDPAWQEAIRMARSPEKAKKMGLARDHPARGDWAVVRDRVMKSALLKKFSQNPIILATLQKTGTRLLVEASPGDDYWGIGKNKKGENKLGKMLMEVRTELKDVRPEEAVFGVGPPPIRNYVEDPEESGENTDAEDMVEQATAAVQAGGFRAAGSNPIYMFINPGSAVETKGRRARQSGSGRSLAWDGMISKEGSQEGGSRQDGDSLTVEKDHAVEVKVEKLG